MFSCIPCLLTAERATGSNLPFYTQWRTDFFLSPLFAKVCSVQEFVENWWGPCSWSNNTTLFQNTKEWMFWRCENCLVNVTPMTNVWCYFLGLKSLKCQGLFPLPGPSPDHTTWENTSPKKIHALLPSKQTWRSKKCRWCMKYRNSSNISCMKFQNGSHFSYEILE